MLGPQVQEKAIGGYTYKVTPLSSGVSLKVMARVLKMAAPAFADVASLRDAASAVGRLLGGLASDLDESTLEYVTGELAKVTRVDLGNNQVQQLAQVFETHFQGRIVDLLDWLRFAAEVTYGPLLARLQAQLAPEAATPPNG